MPRASTRSAALILAITLSLPASLAHHQGAGNLERRSHLGARLPTPVKRAAGDPYPEGPAYDIPPLVEITPIPADAVLELPTLPSTFPPGATPTIGDGFPALPAFTPVPEEWPVGVPDVGLSGEGPEVDRWMEEIANSGVVVPPARPHVSRSCTSAENTEIDPNRGLDGSCWWTCGGCVRPDDISTCSDPLDYAFTVDDGPSDYTPQLLRYLESVDKQATFFVLGPNVLRHPETVQYEFMTGHEIAVHTWTHTALTTLTDRQVVAELGWTREIIRRVTGVSPRLMRPPYGDIDDRVRALSHGLGMIPVMWNGDSQDWSIRGEGTPVPAATVQADFETLLDSAEEGLVMLHHDTYKEYISIAAGHMLPAAMSHNPPFNIVPVNVCQGNPIEDAYVETNTNGGGDDETEEEESSIDRSGTRSGTATRSATSDSGDGQSGNGSGRRVDEFVLPIALYASLTGVLGAVFGFF